LAIRTFDEAAKDPSTQSAAYDKMRVKWDMLETLLGGTAAMREAGRLYLPQHQHEEDTAYKERLERTTLTNYTAMTLDSLVGKPFSDPVKPNDDVPADIKAMFDDIDLQGNSLHVFCRSWFREGLAKAFCHVLVDFPKMSAEERANRTLADDIRENRRPYWVLIKPENLIFAASENINGVEVLTHVRICQHVTERVGFTERAVEKILVLERGWYQVWKEVEAKGSRKMEWVLEEEGETGLDVVPLVTFYSDRQGFMMGKPPLEDLGHMNVRHWQSTSDQINVLTVARFPMLAVSGTHDAKGDSIAIGPKQLLGTRDPAGKFYYVEHSGKAIEAGLKDIEKIEDDMASYGAEFLRKRPNGQTATARALDSVESTSPLQDMTLRFIDSVAMVLYYTALWMGKEEGGTVLVTTDFGPEKVNDIDFRTLLESRRNRDISRQDFLEELQRRGTLPDDFDFERNLDALENEPTFDSPFATGQSVKARAEMGIADKDGEGEEVEEEEVEEGEEDDKDGDKKVSPKKKPPAKKAPPKKKPTAKKAK
jgi:hypothetical protein